ncbi:MAG: hypothetical protein RBG13Loki_1172 [Promethearchaeota archaeon CR_4]|nr:MAG: hypothetical protein RBG13Loki_1172 [Candidatus Lokiarchaeota archaeon CR_4]
MTESLTFPNKSLIQSDESKEYPQEIAKIVPVTSNHLSDISIKVDEPLGKLKESKTLRKLFKKMKYNPRYLQETESVDHLKQRLNFRTNIFY